MCDMHLFLLSLYVQMIFLFILQELRVLETKGCALYRRALQLLEVSLYERNIWHRRFSFVIVISLSKIHDRDWSYPCHVICINNQCCPMHQHPGATFMLPGNITGEHDQQNVIPCIRG